MQAVLARLNSTASEGIVGRTLKAITKDDEELQEQKPRNLEDDLLIGKDENGKFIDPAPEEVDTGDIFTAFRKAGLQLAGENSKNKGLDATNINTLVSCFDKIKGFKSAIGSALNDSHNVSWGPTNFGRNENGPIGNYNEKKRRLYAMGVILISMAYLPGGSESILNACDGLKIGGIRGSGDDFIGHASKVRKEIKKLALKGATGDKLVNKLKSSNASGDLVRFVDKASVKQIMNKFGKWAKLERKAVNEKAKAGKKIKDLKTAYREDGVKGVLKKINPFSKSKNKKGSKSDEQSQNENV